MLELRNKYLLRKNLLLVSIFFLLPVLAGLGNPLELPHSSNDSISSWQRASAYLDTAWEKLYTDPEQTRSYANKLLKLANKEGLIRPKSSAYTMLGLYYEAIGQYAESIDHYHQAIKTLAPYDSLHQYMSSAYSNISIVHYFSGNEQKAIEYAHKALKIEKSNDDTYGEITSYLSLGNFYQKLNKFDSSLYYFKRSLALNNDQFPDITASVYANMGEIYFKRKQYDSAYYVFQYNYDFVYGSESATLDDKLDANFDLASYYMITQEYPKAITYLNVAASIADSLKKVEYRPEILNLYSRYYEETGNLARSYDFYKQANELQDSIVGAEVKENIAQLESRYQHEKKNLEIKQLLAETRLKDLAIEKQQAQQDHLIIFLVLCGILVILIFSFYVSSRRKTKRLAEQNEIIKKAHLELQDMMRETHHRIKNNLQVVSSLLKLQSKNASSSESRASILEAYNRIKTIAMMHQRLQGTHSFKTVDMHKFIMQLTNSIKDSLSGTGDSVTIVSEVDRIEMETDKSIAIALVINEVITNSFKYAFIDDGEGKIKVNMHKQDQITSLHISDNGCGLPDDFDPETDSKMGFKIIKSLTSKLQGQLNIKNDSGLTVQVTFPT